MLTFWMCEANMMNTVTSHGSDQFKRGAGISGLDTDVISAFPLRLLCADAPAHDKQARGRLSLLS
jgi:hypothetical protein